MSKNLKTIVIDAMGGDHGPKVTVEAAINATKNKDLAIILVGDIKKINLELDRYEEIDKQLIKVFPSDGVVQEDEHPALAFKSKPKASIFVSAGIVKSGKADGFISMGSTGASIAAATVLFGTHDGVDRGALGGPIIGFAPKSIIIDLGTNVDTKPNQLVDFAALGNIMSKKIYNIDNPRIAILSVGSEEGKGNNLVKETSRLLSNTDLNFTGNIEPNEIPFSKADVILCDGFVGNVVLKLTEGLGEATVELIKNQLGESDESKNLQNALFEKMNTLAAFGGGPLLGVKGLAIVGHGSSDANGITNAVETAKFVINTNLIEAQKEELTKVRKQINR
ncbi:MAG: phosphate acyltransferase PlsX [Dehalococcoidia bacterium]